MNYTLKAAGRIGAELGAAKAANERLRGLLRELREITSEYAWDADLEARVDAALSQQAEPAEPTETYTAVEMATAAAQGFRDGQAAVEPAPAQDEREAEFGDAYQGAREDLAIWKRRALEAEEKLRSAESATRSAVLQAVVRCERAGAFKACMECGYQDGHDPICKFHESRLPAQTEQQPVGYQFQDREGVWKQFMSEKHYEDTLADGTWPIRAIYAAPIAQTAPQGKFRMGDLVKKSTGSEWEGRVVGWYSTEQTKEGYAVESEAHAGSVQIYPAKALEAVE